MPAHKHTPKQPAGANKKPVGVSKKPAAADGRYRPSFKIGDIAMKAAFDHGVPLNLSNDVYAAVVIKNTKVAQGVQFACQLAVQDPAELGVRAKSQTKTKKHVLSTDCAQTFAQHTYVPSTNFEIAKVVVGSDVGSDSTNVVSGSDVE